ncbi:MAG: LCP family protein [Anaerolineales bacterium]|nr:LCP family protein [Anaerolineales bacterium]
MSSSTSGGAAQRGSRRTLIWAGLLLVVILGAALAARFWFAPLGPALQSGEAAHGAATNIAGPATPASTPLPAAATAAAAAATGATAAPPPDCGEHGVMRILALGSDTRTNDYTTGRADFIRAVRADFDTGGVRMLSIPRDLWVPIPNLAEHGIVEDRVNTAYAYGNYYQLPGGGPTLMAETLRGSLGLEFDHYLIVNFAAVEAGIDAIGGVDIELPKDIDGTPQGLPYFRAGVNHMDGATLLQYVRIRFIDSDLQRIDRQNQVLLAVRAKLLSPALVGAVPGLISAMQDLILSDLSPTQLASLACLGRNTGLSNITQLKIGEEQVTHTTTEGGATVLMPRYDLIALVLAAYGAP